MAVHPCRVFRIPDSVHCAYYMEMLPSEQEEEDDQGWFASRRKHYICAFTRSAFKLELEAVR